MLLPVIGNIAQCQPLHDISAEDLIVFVIQEIDDIHPHLLSRESATEAGGCGREALVQARRVARLRQLPQERNGQGDAAVTVVPFCAPSTHFLYHDYHILTIMIKMAILGRIISSLENL